MFLSNNKYFKEKKEFIQNLITSISKEMKNIENFEKLVMNGWSNYWKKFGHQGMNDKEFGVIHFIEFLKSLGDEYQPKEEEKEEEEVEEYIGDEH